MNTFISNLDGEQYKGFIIALFTISAGLARPFSGKLSDTIGRKRVMIVGLTVCGLMSLFYPICYNVVFFLILRFFHGFSTGFYPTGATALVTDIIPEEKRGSAMGIFGTFISLGIGIAQGVSTLVVHAFGTNGLFVAALVLVLISFVLLFYSKETLENPQKFKFSLLAIKEDEIIERKVIPVAIVMLLSSICSGIVFVITPDLTEQLHMNNKGAFFIFYVVATILVRLFTGGISDRFGRRKVLVAGMSILSIAMYYTGFSTNAAEFIIGSVLSGIATGICSPTIFAWTADLSPSHRRGIGAGTMFIALELGICIGSLATNFIYQNKVENIKWVFVFGTGATVLTVVYLLWHLVRFPRTTSSQEV